MEISIDSRSVNNPQNTRFFALVGKNHDGHDYIKGLYDKGVRHFVVSEWREEFDSMQNTEFIRCADTLVELQRLACEHRANTHAEVVGITGSNGKTVVKEWIAQMMEDDVALCRSPRSYNSQVGVPLSLFEIGSACKVALIEAGMSRPGEMAVLHKIIRPDVGIFTHLGDAHSENFPSLEEKLQEKCALFEDCQTVICRAGKPAFVISSVLRPTANILVWGLTEDSVMSGAQFCGGHDTVRVNTISVTPTERRVFVRLLPGTGHLLAHSLSSGPSEFNLVIPFPDEASFENCMTAVCYLLYRGYGLQTIAKRVGNLQPIAMRMEIKEGINGCTLIKDYYNSDLASFALALNTLSTQDASKEKVVVLSDFVDVGSDSADLYQKVSDLLRKAGVSVFIGIGPNLTSNRPLFSVPESRFYEDTDGFIKQEDRESYSDQVILLKGARKFRFEYIAGFLQKQSHTTVLEVDLDAMAHNLSRFRSLVPPQTKIAVMVKAFSYGSGSGEVASLLQYNGVNYLMVAFADEGVELRSRGITIPIAVMNPEPEAFDNMIEFELEPEIYSMELLELFDAALRRHGIEHYPVHLKINTGMNRSGLDQADIPALLDFFGARGRNVMLRSMFSHLAVSDEPSQDEFTLGQISLFTSIYEQVQPSFPYKILRHILNSAGIERFPQYAFDMVRLGIGLHGIRFDGSMLEPVSSFKTHIASIREVPADQTVGYGRKGHLSRASQIAVIPVGYADGLNRHLSCGVGEMLVHGHRAPIVGNICMDACMLDITGLGAHVGDEVEIFGKHIPVTEISDKLGTIPYEVLTGISQRVKRVYYKE